MDGRIGQIRILKGQRLLSVINDKVVESHECPLLERTWHNKRSLYCNSKELPFLLTKADLGYKSFLFICCWQQK